MSSNVSKWPYQKVLPSTDIEHTVLPQRVTLSMFPLYSCASLAANIEHSVQPLSLPKDHFTPVALGGTDSDIAKNFTSSSYVITSVTVTHHG